MTLIQNNHCAKVAYSAPPRYLGIDRKGVITTDISIGSTVICPLVGTKYLLNEFLKGVNE